ncbi:hypothetical protein BHE74_00047916, partial [Ensete ventricosum]
GVTVPDAHVGAEEIEKAISRLMDGGEKGEGRRERARELGRKAKEAMEVGGSSYANYISIALVKTYLDLELAEMHLAKDWSRCTQQMTDRNMTSRDALGKELAEICSTRTGQDALGKGPTMMCSSRIGRDTISNGLAKICSAKDRSRCAWQGLIEMCLEGLVEMRSSKDWCDVLGKD